MTSCTYMCSRNVTQMASTKDWKKYLYLGKLTVKDPVALMKKLLLLKKI